MPLRMQVAVRCSAFLSLLLLIFHLLSHPGKSPRRIPALWSPTWQSPPWIYEQVYFPRGDLGNSELHHGMEIGRTSCTDFWASQRRRSN